MVPAAAMCLAIVAAINGLVIDVAVKQLLEAWMPRSGHKDRARGKKVAGADG